MADPVTIGAAVGWGMKAAGWILSPIISKLVGKGFSYLSFDTSEKLKQLEVKVLQLELILGLEEAEVGPYKNRIEPLLKNLKSAFYDAEDILDDVEYHHLERQILNVSKEKEVLSHPCKRKWVHKIQSAMPKCSCLKNQESDNLSDEAPPDISKTELKKILEKIENIINQAHQILQLLNLPSHSNVHRRQTVAANSRSAVTTAAPPPSVIGRDKDHDKIRDMLHNKVGDGQPNANSSLCYSVIGIHGIPGSGKSTLAQLVCASEKKDKEEKKNGHFNLIMWVHVSQNFNVDAIFSEMFEAATGSPCPQFHNRDTLQQKLEDELSGKQFLLVLDDVWYKNSTSQQELQKIVSPLKVGEAGSKILVTSRTEDALLALGAVTCIPISELDDSVFLKLFMHYALGGANIDERDRRIFEVIGSDIAKKLRRSPLAARTVGGQLRMRPNVDFWRDARNRDLLNETMGALWWSYQHLDEQAKRCFAYCCIFPRRHRLKRDELIKLWVAEGFISTTDAEEEMEAVGGRYLDELVSASFLQSAGKLREFGVGIDSFTVHDLLHDLAEKVSGSYCFRIENGWSGEVPKGVRHLFLETYNEEIITNKIVKLENLRTLIIHKDVDMVFDENVFRSIFTSLRKLRVLNLSRIMKEILSVPSSIGQFKHLRFLGIQTGYLTKIILPSTSTKLYHMQVLDCGECRDVRFSSGEDMCNLINLRHIISRSDLFFPNIGRLTLLQTTPSFTVKKELGYELQQLAHLNKLCGKLQIHGLENAKSKEEAVEANLAGKERLKELVLAWDDERCNLDVQAEVLEGLCPPMELEVLEIWGYQSLRYPSWLEGKQNGPKFLQELGFKGCSRLGSIPEHSELFAHLRSLCFFRCEFDSLPDNMDRLTSLQHLGIMQCPKILLLPTLPESLEVFRLNQCSGLLMRSCQTIQDPNWQKN